MRNEISNEYFEWLLDCVCGDRYAKGISHRKLLTRLHTTIFRYSIPRDHNRAEDGISLRYRFALTKEYEVPTDLILDALDGPCSVLEMMIALSLRCEDLMDDTRIGDRTRQWFWGMISNLGLNSMPDAKFDRRAVDDALNRFMDRDYAPDGRGGLFRIRDCDLDLRDVEIWVQMCRYLDTIADI